jgi:hypothetical protein
MYMYTYSILFRLHTTTEIFILVECHKKVAPGVLGREVGSQVPPARGMAIIR